MAQRNARLLVGLVLGTALAACSSAPLPQALTQELTGAPAGTTGTTGSSATPGATGSGTGTGGTTGAVGPGTTGGSTGAVGTTGGSTGGTGGGTSGGSGATTGPSAVQGLFTPAEDRIGITPNLIRMCAHAALTYGAAFNTSNDDLNVFWTALNTEKGGVFGRKVEVTYENDDYKPDTAVVAAKACEAKKIFMLLGGIGFDQIPTVRNYVESRHLLYLHHTATIKGSAGQKYSFSALPTVERMGEGFAQLAASKYKGKRIGILKRDSVNWEPGVSAFKAVKERLGLTIVDEEKAATNAGNYTSQIQNLKNAEADVVWIWLNALETTQVVKQMKALAFSPHLMVFPFNLTSQALDSDALNPVMDGVAMYPAYSNRDYGGPFARYADDMKQFEAQYAKYRPNADLAGVGGDLLFLNWTAQKAAWKLLVLCGKDCTRNRFVQVLQGYHATPISSACPIDFRYGDRHHGASYVTFMETYRTGNASTDKVNWRETRHCVGGL